MYRSLKRGNARVSWKDSPRGDDDDDARRRTLPRQFGRSTGTAAPAGGLLRHSETLPRTGARPGLTRQPALDMLDTGWLDDDLRQVGVPVARSSSRRRSSYYRGESDISRF